MPTYPTGDLAKLHADYLAAGQKYGFEPDHMCRQLGGTLSCAAKNPRRGATGRAASKKGLDGEALLGAARANLGRCAGGDPTPTPSHYTN